MLRVVFVLLFVGAAISNVEVVPEAKRLEVPRALQLLDEILAQQGEVDAVE